MTRSQRSPKGIGIMLSLFCLVALCAAFMGGVVLTSGDDMTNRLVALVIFVALLAWLVVFAIGLRRAIFGRWLTDRVWRDVGRELGGIEPRGATAIEVRETERLPVHVLSPEVLGVKRGGGIDHMMVGSLHGQEIRVCNVRVRAGGWFDVPAVALHLEVDMAPTLIRPMTGRLRVPPRPGMRPVLLESEQFNRTIGVFSADSYFATAMLDARMMRWLMERSERCVIELSDRWAVVWALPRTGRRVRPAQLIEFLEAFDAQVPRAVPSLFPKSDRRLLWKSST